jgi:cation diffusion facilitator CzcD-associated flavoprotein CzcO
MVEHHRVIIVGAGLSGIGLGAQLQKSHIDDFIIIERQQSVGGVWFNHEYPGCQCDIPGHLYSFSFAPNPDWTRIFPKQGELLQYLQKVTADRGLGRHLRLGTEVLRCEWDETARRWLVTTSSGVLTCDALVSAVGLTSVPALPDIPGLDTFEGERFHSAQWNWDYDLSGKRVAVIGTGPSAVQIVPEIQPKVEQLTVFQRTPVWIMSHFDRPVSDRQRRMLRRFPFLMWLYRRAFFLAFEAAAVGFRGRLKLLEPAQTLSLKHLERQVPDPDLRAALTPKHLIGCKRPIFSDRFYPALMEDNVDLVTNNIDHVDEGAVVTKDGTRYEVDAIITASGYRIVRSILEDRIFGVGGKSLEEAWGGAPRAYKSTTVPEFPNFFILLGPNSVLGSAFIALEAQAKYVVGALRHMDSREAKRLEVLREPLQLYIDKTAEESAGTVWMSGCNNPYRDENGQNFVVFPGSATQFQKALQKFDAAAYDIA